MKCKDNLSYCITVFSLPRYFIFISFICLTYTAFSQLNLNFNSGSLMEQNWEGNTDHFIINEVGELQLNAPEAGNSTIFTPYRLPPDSLQVDIFFKLKFAPSSDNFSKIYLFLDRPTENMANGYYLQLGESGSNDAIKIFKLTNGQATLFAAAKLGAIQKDPAIARIQFKIYTDGFWIMMTDYTGNKLYDEDIEFLDSDFSLQQDQYFGIYCQYTATRVDKFFFDDISIQTIVKDIVPPDLVSVEVLDKRTVQLTFSEALESQTASNVLHYTVDQGLGQPQSITFSNSKPNVVILNFVNEIRSGIEYRLSVEGVRDKNGNTTNGVASFTFIALPELGDIIISEVLTDPNIGGEDFIELYNNSNKTLQLKGLIIRNGQKTDKKQLESPFVLLPDHYVAISKNVSFLKETYKPMADAQYIENNLPAFNVSSAQIVISTSIENGELVLDSFDYNDTYHFSLLDETKGVSLEKIDLKGSTNDINNWHSGTESTNFATPGYKNSNNILSPNNATSILIPDKKQFSPDGDGDDDFLLLQYSVEKPGFLAQILIYNADGYLIRNLANNYLLGTEGSIKWDGVNDEGVVEKIGMYIVYCKIFHPDGDVRENKNVVVIGHKF